ncbi:MAG: RNA-binding S4 domain-containing protein [Clostridia bacterium]|nr:RNA-binding S4 domain-containing protein [Clostridia bacterium]
MTEIFIKEEYIKLDSALKLANLVSTGGHAKFVIKNGEVKVNGEVCLQRGKKLHINDIFEFENNKTVIKNAD